MAAMAKLWRFISPERIGFFLQKLEVLFASCYSIQNIFLRIFKVTGRGQIKLAQMSHFGTTLEVKTGLTSFFDAMPPSFYHSGIFNLIKRWRYVVDNDGDYCPDKFEV